MNWFFEMPDWAFLLMCFPLVIAFVSFMARKEIAAWWKAIQDPEYLASVQNDAYSFLPF